LQRAKTGRAYFFLLLLEIPKKMGNLRAMKIILALIAVVSIVTLPACKKKEKGDQFAGVDGDFVTSTPLGERFEGGANFFSSSVVKGQFQPVYFGFDSYSVEPPESSKIQQVSSRLSSASDRLIIAGFTDERGTQEYNRGLGERRAQAVRQALIDAGIASDRIQTVSFGSEMPADPASTEAAWAKNRRAEFGVVKKARRAS
jgi:peptidoglycan-associated lipoprotein